MVATEILGRYGFQCDIVSTGRQAMEAVLSRSYDVVLMDCQMPDMDGFEATRAIRRAEETDTNRRRTPIVALTANAVQGDREACLAAGMDGYVTKPIRPTELIEVLQTMLGNVDGPASLLQPMEPLAAETAPAEGTAAQTPSAEPAAPVGLTTTIELKSLLHRCMGDTSFCANVLQRFMGRAFVQLAQIEQAHRDGDVSGLVATAHALKAPLRICRLRTPPN